MKISLRVVQFVLVLYQCINNFITYKIMKDDFCYSDPAWRMIKHDKTRIAQTANLLRKYTEGYKQLLEDDEIVPDTTFAFVYFFTMMKRRPNFNYDLFR